MKRNGGGKIGLADSARVRKKNPSGVLEKVSSPFRGHMTPTGNERANGISEREPNNEADCESDCASPARPQTDLASHPPRKKSPVLLARPERFELPTPRFVV
jgi:hypothetical protein